MLGWKSGRSRIMDGPELWAAGFGLNFVGGGGVEGNP